MSCAPGPPRSKLELGKPTGPNVQRLCCVLRFLFFVLTFTAGPGHAHKWWAVRARHPYPLLRAPWIRARVYGAVCVEPRWYRGGCDCCGGSWAAGCCGIIWWVVVSRAPPLPSPTAAPSPHFAPTLTQCCCFGWWCRPVRALVLPSTCAPEWGIPNTDSGPQHNGLVPFQPQRALPCPASPFLLVHLPKCAGTSMRAAVSRILFRAKVPHVQQCIPGAPPHTGRETRLYSVSGSLGGQARQ